MSEQETEGDVLHWVESLRDRVGKVSGRPRNGSDSGFNSELKGELLDAMDLLLQQVGGIDLPPDPVGLAAEHFSIRVGELLENLQNSLRCGIDNSLDKSKDAVEHAQNLCRQLEDDRTAQSAKLEGFREWIESSLSRQQTKEDTALQIVEQFRSTSNAIQEVVEGLEASQAQLEDKLKSLTRSADANEALVAQLQSLVHSWEVDCRSHSDAVKQLDSQVEQTVERFRSESEAMIGQALESKLSVLDRMDEICRRFERLPNLLPAQDGDSPENGREALQGASIARCEELWVQLTQVSETLQRQSNGTELEELRRELQQAKNRAAELEEELQGVHSQRSSTPSLHSELAESLEQEESSQELNAARQQLEDQRQQLILQSDEIENRMRDLEQADACKKELEDMVAALQQRLDQATCLQETNSEQLSRNLDDARHEIKILKKRNSDLQDQVARSGVARHGSAGQESVQPENLSWEDRKRLMLQQLEDDGQQDVPRSKRFEMEQVIAKTDLALREKEQELKELKRLLDEERGLAVDRSSQRQILDNDELVQQERDKLRMMQQEWEEKLRKAEIDLSIERAKLARERSELEQELSNLRSSQSEEPAELPDAGKGRKRKWLDHLGLRDDSKNKDG